MFIVAVPHRYPPLRITPVANVVGGFLLGFLLVADFLVNLSVQNSVVDSFGPTLCPWSLCFCRWLLLGWKFFRGILRGRTWVSIPL